jgi:hypothetical protein
MKKFYKNKKAVASPLVDFYAYIAFALVILTFFLLFKAGAGQIQQVITSDMIEFDDNLILQNYFKTPITTSKGQIPFAEFLAENPKDYQNIMKNTEIIFQKFNKTQHFQALFNIDNNKCIFDCGNIQAAACVAKYGLIYTTLPTYDGNTVNMGFCFWVDQDKYYQTKQYECRKRAGC